MSMDIEVEQTVSHRIDVLGDETRFVTDDFGEWCLFDYDLHKKEESWLIFQGS